MFIYIQCMLTYLKMCTFNFMLCIEVIVKGDVVLHYIILRCFFPRLFAFIDCDNRRITGSEREKGIERKRE